MINWEIEYHFRTNERKRKIKFKTNEKNSFRLKHLATFQLTVEIELICINFCSLFEFFVFKYKFIFHIQYICNEKGILYNANNIT